MAEKSPRLSQEVVDLAWEAVEASNRAFDNIRGSLTDQERANAQADFDVLTDMASSAWQLPDSPFDPSSLEYAVRSAGVEVPEAIESLDYGYKSRIITRYIKTSKMITIRINNGSLPETYKMPDLNEFADRLVALAPSYEAWVAEGWEPEVVFVPEELSHEQWNNLLRGHKLKNGRSSEGVSIEWEGIYNPIDITAPTTKETDHNLWDVAVMSGLDHPALVNVSPDGTHGNSAAETIKLLSKLPSFTPSSSMEGIIKQFSPSQDMHFAFELARLNRGERPADVDTENWTIGKEKIVVDGAPQSLFYYWRSATSKVCSSWVSIDYSRASAIGVRPSVRGKDLVRGSQSIN